MSHDIRPLTTETWDAFAALAEKHNGVWGGCWCTWFHADVDAEDRDTDGKRALGHREFKRRMVEQGVAHAALVFDGEQAIAWCEYGTPAELPRIYHRKEYNAGLVELPHYRITCFFIDRDHRRVGVAQEALDGAVGLIAAAGGGLVDSYPHDLQGKRMSSSFLHNGTRTMFEKAGFDFERPLGKSRCVMRKVVAAA